VLLRIAVKEDDVDVKAHNSTSRSPELMLNCGVMDRKASPVRATTTASTAFGDCFCPRNTQASSGVNTIKSPVMKPALLAVVDSSPKVWNAYDIMSRHPRSAPAPSVFLSSRDSLLTHRTSITANARINRQARKTNG
jgi:hypothetical protein